MKRGFKVTLMTVAVAMLGYEAMAMAPVISDIPSPIVGSVPQVTGATPYVFGDALDLNSYVSDDTTPNDQLKWSYAIAGTPKYAINGVAPIDVASEDPNNPGAKQINNQVLQNESNPDGQANTITIRNINLSPFSGTGATASGTGIIDSQVVTLFASDGSTYSAKDVIFYSDNGGQNRLSGNTVNFTPVVTHDFKSGTNGWGWDNPIVAGVTSSANQAICIASPMAGGGMGDWSSAYGMLPLVNNAVYRIRAQMNFTQVQAGATTPFWDISINNYKSATGQGLNLYGGDFYFLDNEGGANAISTASGGSSFEMWWCPSPIQTPQWQAGANTPAADANNDAFLQFRVIDLDSIGGLTAANDGGTICMSNLTIDRVDLTQLTAPANLTNVYNVTSFTQNQTASASFLVDNTSKADFTGGTITLTPGTNGGQDTEYGTVTPGDTTLDLTQPNTIPDNYPVTWDANTLYMITMNLSAPDANSEANPWDVFWIAMDSPTNEVIAESFVTGSLNRVGMPKQGTPQTYTAFFYSENGTKTALQNGNRLRPRLAVGNNTGLSFNPNTGSLRIHSMRVDKVALPK